MVSCRNLRAARYSVNGGSGFSEARFCDWDQINRNTSGGIAVSKTSGVACRKMRSSHVVQNWVGSGRRSIPCNPSSECEEVCREASWRFPVNRGTPNRDCGFLPHLSLPNRCRICAPVALRIQRLHRLMISIQANEHLNYGGMNPSHCGAQ